MMKNIQKQNNKVKFRMEDNPTLEKEFKQIFDKTDIFINPTHTIMGNQGKLKKRREFLSKDGRIFCSVSNADTDIKQNINHKSVQYCFHDRKDLEGADVIDTDSIVMKVYQI